MNQHRVDGSRSTRERIPRYIRHRLSPIDYFDARQRFFACETNRGNLEILDRLDRETDFIFPACCFPFLFPFSTWLYSTYNIPRSSPTPRFSLRPESEIFPINPLLSEFTSRIFTEIRARDLLPRERNKHSVLLNILNDRELNVQFIQIKFELIQTSREIRVSLHRGREETLRDVWRNYNFNNFTC